MTQERTLVGAETYIVGEYHFTNGNALVVADEHIEYLDSLTDSNGDPLFAAEAQKTDRKSVTISVGGKKQQDPKQAEGGKESVVV